MKYYRERRRLESADGNNNISTIFLRLILLFCIIIVFFVGIGQVVAAKRLHSEAEYVDYYCKGTVEYRNSDKTRTDCYTKENSMEYDFAQKWYECIGQALHYARLNNNYPVCVLILEKDSDFKYLNRAKLVVRHYELPMQIWVVRKY